jgi:hypothetical protein
LIRYVLSDAYLRFFYALMRPELDRIKSGQSTIRFASLVQKPVFHSWRGRAFELTCAQHAHLIARALGFHGIEYGFGPYFRTPKKQRKGVEIDLVFDRADNVLTLCEMKCSRKRIGKSIVADMERKAAVLSEDFPRKTIQNVIVYHGSICADVARSPYIYEALDSGILFS